MKREKTCSYIALDSGTSHFFYRCLCWRTCGASQYLWIYQLLRVHVLNLHRILYYKLLTNKLHFQLDSGLLTSTNACALANKQINYTFMYWNFTAQQYDATVCVRNDVTHLHCNFGTSWVTWDFVLLCSLIRTTTNRGLSWRSSSMASLFT